MRQPPAARPRGFRYFVNKSASDPRAGRVADYDAAVKDWMLEGMDIYRNKWSGTGVPALVVDGTTVNLTAMSDGREATGQLADDRGEDDGVINKDYCFSPYLAFRVCTIFPFHSFFSQYYSFYSCILQTISRRIARATCSRDTWKRHTPAIRSMRTAQPNPEPLTLNP